MIARRLPPWFALVAGALLAGLGCNDDGVTIAPPPSITLELHAREGLILSSPPRAITGAELTAPGLLLPRNDDDSDRNGNADHLNAIIDGADDERQLAVLTVKKLGAPAQAGDKLHLKKKSGAGNVRVFRKEATHVLSVSVLDTGTDAGAQTSDAVATDTMAKAQAGDAEFYVEGNAHGEVELCVAWAGSVTVEECVKLKVRNGFGPVVFGDHDRDGTTATADRAKRTTHSAIVFVNADHDCPPLEPRVPDSIDGTICAGDEEDIGHIKVDISRLAGLPAGWKPVLRILDANKSYLNVFDGITSGSTALPRTLRTVALIPFQEMDISALVADAAARGATEATLGIEGIDWNRKLDLLHCVVNDATGIDAACDRMKLETTTARLQGNNEPVKELLVSDMGLLNDLMRADLEDALPLAASLWPVRLVPPKEDQWLQDEMEIMGSAAPRGNAQLVVALPRGGELRSWVLNLLGPNVALKDLSGLFPPPRPPDPQYGAGEGGGNLEVTPPGPGSQGRLCVGDNMHPDLVTALEQLTAQTPKVRVDVSWLAIGHVDEVLAFYPHGASWRVAVASTGLGKQLMSDQPSHAALFWHCRGEPWEPRIRAADCYGEGRVISAEPKEVGRPAKLRADGFVFNDKPAGREWQWIRIYTGRGRGQVAHVRTIVDSDEIEVDHVWDLPTPDFTRCAARRLDQFPCDHVAAGLTPRPAASPLWPAATFRKDTWFRAPAAGDRFVVVEDTLDWDRLHAGSAAGGRDDLPLNVPALMTAGELSDATFNRPFLDKQNAVEEKLNDTERLLHALPGHPTVVRIPALYNVLGDLTGGEAYVPGVINFQVVQGTAPGSAKLFAPRPYGPSVNATDPWEAMVTTRLGMTSPPTFTDTWDVYHLNSGEVHCGTNLFKAEARKWWK